MFKLNLCEPRIIEIAGLAGIDAVWLCNEHVPNDWSMLENQIRAAKLHDVDTIVRVSRGSYSDYIRPLEADATGIMVPHVASAEEARQIVDWVRFHPVGRRPIDGGNADGCFAQLPVKEYLHHANHERIVILQIESPEALEKVEEIAAVPGFDMLLFGGGDFSHRIGKAGAAPAAELASARRRVAAAAQKFGKYAASPGLPAPLPELLAEGHRLFGLGADVVGLGEYFRNRIDRIKAAGNPLAGSPGRPTSEGE